MHLMSAGWTGVGGVNDDGPAADVDDGGAAVAFPSPSPLSEVDDGDGLAGTCSMTTFIRLLLEGRRSPFFFSLPIFARDLTQRRR